MADDVTLEFLGARMERMLARQDQLQEDMRVLTAIVLRHENTLIDILQQVRAMVSQHSLQRPSAPARGAAGAIAAM
jgi:hypothetical protein